MDMTRVKLEQKSGVTRTSVGERAIARLLTAETGRKPHNQAEQDLLTDAFHAYHGQSPALKEQVAPDREVNKALVDWLMDARNYEEGRQSTAGNIASSLVTGALAWTMMCNDDSLSEALNKQAEAERWATAAKNTLEQALELDKTDPERAEPKRQMAERAMEAAKSLSQEAVEKIESMRESPTGQVVMNTIAEDAKEKGEKVTAVMRSWGVEPGDMGITDVDSILSLASDSPMGDKLKEIAKLAGRLKGLAMNVAHDTRRGMIGTATKAGKTSNIAQLFQSEFVQISRKAARAMRAVKISQFVDQGGLLGWIPTSSRKEQGDVEFYIDASGSMTGNPEIVAKAVCLGIARALRDDRSGNVNRWYRLSTFSTRKFVRCSCDNSWREHLEWAAKSPRGGTDFNYVFESAIEKIRERHHKGKRGTDMILITDGISGLSEEVIQKWYDLVDETGARLITIAIGIPPSYVPVLGSLSDLMISIDSHAELETLVDKITKQITENIVGAERR